MRYLLKFWDKKEMVVSEEDGKKIIFAKEKKIDCVKMLGGIYEVKAIAYVEPLFDRLELPEYECTPRSTGNAANNAVKKETIERLNKEVAEKFNWNKKI